MLHNRREVEEQLKKDFLEGNFHEIPPKNIKDILSKPAGRALALALVKNQEGRAEEDRLVKNYLETQQETKKYNEDDELKPLNKDTFAISNYLNINKTPNAHRKIKNPTKGPAITLETIRDLKAFYSAHRLKAIEIAQEKQGIEIRQEIAEKPTSARASQHKERAQSTRRRLRSFFNDLSCKTAVYDAFMKRQIKIRPKIPLSKQWEMALQLMEQNTPEEFGEKIKELAKELNANPETLRQQTNTNIRRMLELANEFKQKGKIGPSAPPTPKNNIDREKLQAVQEDIYNELLQNAIGPTSTEILRRNIQITIAVLSGIKTREQAAKDHNISHSDACKIVQKISPLFETHIKILEEKHSQSHPTRKPEEP